MRENTIPKESRGINMVNENINIRVIANLERLLTRKNKLRKMQNRPRINKKDLDPRANDCIYRLRSEINYPNLLTLIKWADALDVDIEELFKPI